MGKNSTGKKEKYSCRTAGPNLLMTDSEYSAVKRMASAHNQSVSSYVREIVLSHRLKSDYSPDQIQRVRSAGQRFNHFVHALHIDSTIVAGSRRNGLQHHGDVMNELHLLEQVLQDTPGKNWRLPINQIPRGKGRRKRHGRVWCTPEEFDQIKMRAERAGMSQSALIRAVLLHRPIGKKTFWHMIDQLERIENNLHQLMNLRTWDYVGRQRINILIRDIDRRVRELSSGRKRTEREP